jgi:CHAD domain-containing protein
MISMKNESADMAVPTVERSFADAARENLQRLREGEAKVRNDGDLEGVHLMRTSCRRLRATVKYLGDGLSRDARKSLKEGLKQIMGDLGEVRDLDVLRQAIDAAPALDPADTETLKEKVEERLADATVRMESTLDGDNYAQLLGALEKAAKVSEDRTLLTHVAPVRIGTALGDALQLRPSDWAAASEESLHDVRKAVKKIRYALEAFAPAYGRPVSRTIERCRSLQESLGIIQDASAFSVLLKGIPTFSAGHFIATMRARAEGETGRLADLWEKAFGPKPAARLGGHLFRRAVREEKRVAAPEGKRKAV